MIRGARPDGFSSSEEQIDAVCDAFEAAWLRGERPHINVFLGHVDHKLQAALFYELLLVDLEYRRNKGERPARDDYRRKFSQFAEQIEAANFYHGASAFATSTGADDDTGTARAHEPGDLVSHFELQECLGTGAMGEVWKAWDSRLRRAVAVKLPRAQALSDADLRRFLREGQAAAQLRHPQLASIHDVGRDGDKAYIVVDYVEGHNLRQYLGIEQLTYQAMAELCAEVAEALHHAHEKGVIHRDLKPANIIIDPTGRPHVIDFGLAKLASDDHDLTMHGELLGTPAYMSPEQVNGDAAAVGRTTDVYSLGVILYELLSGRCPFAGDRQTVLHQILTSSPASPRSTNKKIPRDLETICLKALEKDAAGRYATTQEMAVDLRRFGRGEPILSRRAGPLEKSWRWIRHRPLVALSFALALIAIAAITLARTAAEKNSELLGYKHVSLTTNPPGARIAFARLGDSGELLPEEITMPRRVTPVEVELLPGDYFVEAWWPDGRFHQVLRHVPNSTERVHNLAVNRSRRWKKAGTRGIVVPDIDIPATDITANMQLVSPPDMIKGTNSPLHVYEGSFFTDTSNLTWAQIKPFYPESITELHRGITDNDPVRLHMGVANFERAADIAERVGKRLATSFEYKCLADAGMKAGTQHHPGPSAQNSDAPAAEEIQRVKSLRVAETRQTALDLEPDAPVFPYEYLRYPGAVDLQGYIRCVRSARPRFLRSEAQAP